MEARGFTFPTETLIKLNYKGCRMAEIPITHHFREAGESKVKFFRTVRIMLKISLNNMKHGKSFRTGPGQKPSWSRALNRKAIPRGMTLPASEYHTGHVRLNLNLSLKPRPGKRPPQPRG